MMSTEKLNALQQGGDSKPTSPATVPLGVEESRTPRIPEELSILAVVNAVDPIRRFAECPLGIASHGRNLCPLHRRLDEAAAQVEKAFQETMVAELITVPRKRESLCRFPASVPTS